MTTVKPLAPARRQDHWLWRRPPLYAMLPRHYAAGTTIVDLVGRSWATTGSPTYGASPGGGAITFSGAAQYLTETTATLPTTACTALAVAQAGSSSSDAALFGNRDSQATRILRAYLTTSAALIWDVGGSTYGTNRNAWFPPAEFFGAWHNLAFVAGPGGMSLWSDGVKVDSHAVAASRTNGAAGLYLGRWEAQHFNSALESFVFLDWAVPDEQVREWSADPYAAFRPRGWALVDFGAAVAQPAGGVGLVGPGLVGANPLISFGGLIR